MTASASLWKERLTVPAYKVAEAARYAGTSTQTVNNWQSLGGNRPGAIGPRDSGAALSYVQLIELGVVAAMRKEGLKLEAIKRTRAFLAEKFGSKYPFAEYRFMTDGKELIMEASDLDPSVGDKLIVVSANGQYAWKEILVQLLRQFEYSDGGLVVKWKVGGEDAPILIDPRVCFGAPQVEGVPTWSIRERWRSGEGLKDIASDYAIEPHLVSSALKFEGIQIDLDRPNQWVN